ncbi:MAG: DNA-formamidopyrimidine glycosylase family protein [Bryobacterales bacterium]
MPELPEVETIVRGCGHASSAAPSKTPSSAGRGRVRAIRTRPSETARPTHHGLAPVGKHIVFDLERGGKTSVLVVHLRMTGNFSSTASPALGHAPFSRSTGLR